MKVEYDKHYQTENLFGAPYPELIQFYSSIEQKGKMLDVGCGQGRDAIALAKLGYSVTGIDNSKVGIEQLNKIADKENLTLIGMVQDIFDFSDFDKFDFILLDSMFHFGKKEIEKEINFLNGLIDKANPNTLITICIQQVGKKVDILNAVISSKNTLVKVDQTELIYKYVDKLSGHSSETKYEMITVKKM